MYIAVDFFFYFQNIKDEKRGISQSLKLFTIDLCDEYFFLYKQGKKVDNNFSVFKKKKKKKKKKDIEKMRLYSILASICKTFMVWPGANNQLDYNTVPDIQKYYLDGSNIHIALVIP